MDVSQGGRTPCFDQFCGWICVGREVVDQSQFRRKQLKGKSFGVGGRKAGVRDRADQDLRD